MCLATGFYINAWYATSLHSRDLTDMSSARRVKSAFLRHGICTMKSTPSTSLPSPFLRLVFKMGLYGDLLESGWCTLRKYLIYMAFQ